MNKLADHVAQLCAAFRVKLNIRQDMDPGDAGCGLCVGTCPCGQRVRMPHGNPTSIRCPRCKRLLPTHERCFITIAPITDETTYAVALHELGHILSPLGQCGLTESSKTMQRTNRYATLRDVRLQLEEEMAAWDWARANALEWTEVMASVEAMTFDTYRKLARQLGVKI